MTSAALSLVHAAKYEALCQRAVAILIGGRLPGMGAGCVTLLNLFGNITASFTARRHVQPNLVTNTLGLNG